jgi:uncharacterized integral membrane protein
MFRNIIFIGLIAVVLVVVIQNTQVVEFRFLVWTFAISRALMLFGTLAVGFIAGCLLTLPKGKKEQQGGRKGRK